MHVISLKKEWSFIRTDHKSSVYYVLKSPLIDVEYLLWTSSHLITSLRFGLLNSPRVFSEKQPLKCILHIVSWRTSLAAFSVFQRCGDSRNALFIRLYMYIVIYLNIVMCIRLNIWLFRLWFHLGQIFTPVRKCLTGLLH